MNSNTALRLAPGLRSLARKISCVLMLALVTLPATPVQAAFHVWFISEIYTDASGTNQFIEFNTTFGSQQFVAGQSITITPTGGGGAQTFTIPSNLPGDSANRHFLIGTLSITNFGSPKPDYVIPNGFVAAGGGTLSYFAQGGGPYPALPTDGVLSRAWVAGTNAVNSPRNFAGQTGTISIPSVNTPPTVTLTAPLNGAIFGTPDLVGVTAEAADPGGSIANVQFTTNGVVANTDSTAPYAFSFNNLPIGSYTLRAIAEDNGALKATSAPVSIQVLSGPRLVVAPGTNGPVRLQFQSSNGVNYVIERALPLTNFTPIVTNPGNGGTLQFSDTNSGPVQGTYRVRVQ